MNYKLVNNIFGWVAFVIALIVYLSTMAPTASFWDCGEFIACANELEVPHPPGAPFFLILGRFFALFANGPGTAMDVMGSDGTGVTVAWWVNLISVLSSAFCVMFIFWTTTHLAKKIVSKTQENPDGLNLIAIMASGLVAALAVTFSDSFWFNAVEAEVYALSSFFTAIVVWLMFKWEARADEPDNFKWIILIAFLMGVSIGVHLLNLLAIPALAFIYYFRKYDITPVGVLVTFIVSVAILGAIQVGLIQTSVELAWGFEKLFTGTEEFSPNGFGTSKTGLGLPMGTGVVVFLIISLGILLGLIFITQNRKFSERFFSNYENLKVILNVSAWSFLLVIIGYSSYTMIVIRANANTPINENDPSTVSSMLSYLKREQYGDRPLFTGVRYNDINGYNQVVEQGAKQFVNIKDPRKIAAGTYQLEDGTQVKVNDNSMVEGFSKAGNEGDAYVSAFKDGTVVSIDTKTNSISRVEDRYVWLGFKQEVSYKEGHVLFPRMYSSQGQHYRGAYGYENYVKRKGDPANPTDDKPTMGEDFSYFLDYQFRHMYMRYFMWNFAGREADEQDKGWEAWASDGKDVPAEIANNAGKNHYFLLPLLLGIFGMVFQFIQDRKDGTSVLLLFFFTGLAIIIYLNQTPSQPRERDYSYVGSFQTFAIWIGLSVLALFELVGGLVKNSRSVALAVAMVPFVGPIMMGSENWDDHNRHIRRVAPDSAYNLLNSCEKNGIIFTNGDNDTFPLWYLQEVENVRPDVRVVNLSLLNTDWYISQMKKSSNTSPALPISASQEEYLGETNAFRRWAKGQKVPIPVDPAKVLANGTVKPEYRDIILTPMEWTPTVRGGGGQTYLLKQDWLIMDIVITNARNGWERPIYFSSTIPPSSYVGLQPFFQVEGLANRLVPVDFNKLCQRNDPYNRQGRIDTEISYDKLMNKFRYTELDNPDLYLDDHIRRTIVGNLSSMIFRTANAFVDDADCYTAEISMLEKLKLALDPSETAKADSIQKIIDAKKPKISEWRKKAEEILLMADNKIHDRARGYDMIYPMFTGEVWDRLGNREKSRENWFKVIDKAEEYTKYKEANDWKELDDYDRILGALPWILQYVMREQQDKDVETGNRVAQVLDFTADVLTRESIELNQEGNALMSSGDRDVAREKLTDAATKAEMSRQYKALTDQYRMVMKIAPN